MYRTYIFRKEKEKSKEDNFHQDKIVRFSVCEMKIKLCEFFICTVCDASAKFCKVSLNGPILVTLEIFFVPADFRTQH